MIKSPLRYPGGKSKAIKMIARYFPEKITTFVEPFVGGGSAFIYVAQEYPGSDIVINDINPDVYAFWFVLSTMQDRLINKLFWLHGKYQNKGRELFSMLVDRDYEDLFDKAVKFFVLNRITFSGTIEAGGYSEQAFKNRFTESSIIRLSEFSGLLDCIMSCNTDYSFFLDVFLENKTSLTYLDPPYYKASRLYGKKGCLHDRFCHDLLKEKLDNTSSHWIMSYDDCPEIRELYKDYHITELVLPYGMSKNKKGQELLISNRPLIMN